MQKFPVPNPKDVCAPVVTIRKQPAISKKDTRQNVYQVDVALTIAVSIDLQILNKGSSNVIQNDPDSTPTFGATANSPYFLHFEYEITPFMKNILATDVTVYSQHFAKVYPQDAHSFSIIPWSDGRNLWISWIETSKIDVDADKLICLTEKQECEGIAIKCWSGRSFCNIKTRFDRPKPPKVPPLNRDQDPEMIGGAVKSLVLDISKRCVDLPSAHEASFPFLPHNIIANSLFPSVKDINEKASVKQKPSELIPTTEESVLYFVPSNVPDVDKTYFMLQKLADMDPNIKRIKKMKVLRSESKLIKEKEEKKKKKQKSLIASSPKSSTSQSRVASSRSSKILNSSDQSSFFAPSDSDSESEKQKEQRRLEIEKNGHGKVVINLASFFLTNFDNIKGKVNRMLSATPSDDARTFSEILVKIQLKEPLLNECLHKVLNPMVITLDEIKDLPCNPFVNFDQMNQYCEPVICHYTLGSKINRMSVPSTMQSKVRIIDSQVCLVGTMEPQNLLDFFLKNALEIEVKDRCLKAGDELPQPVRTKHYEAALEQRKKLEKACLYGLDPGDKKISKIDPFLLTEKQRHCEKLPENYGYTSALLDELLKRNCRSLSLSLPLKPKMRDFNSPNDRPELEKISLSNKPKSDTLSGAYLETGTQIKVRVDLSRPLTLNQQDDPHLTMILIGSKQIPFSFLSKVHSSCNESSDVTGKYRMFRITKQATQ
ncbi:hypothetical protein Ciccas_007464 [Cichlidogyrus casuarinus]|uniref:DUF4550 domain-containing protein n=1 Tax=Cichlidogyrus casuarinus TaxID=1844966 RepID=A0ABD2Q6T1_9PLAT